MWQVLIHEGSTVAFVVAIAAFSYMLAREFTRQPKG
jgi:hypothetical protein